MDFYAARLDAAAARQRRPPVPPGRIVGHACPPQRADRHGLLPRPPRPPLPRPPRHGGGGDTRRGAARGVDVSGANAATVAGGLVADATAWAAACSLVAREEAGGGNDKVGSKRRSLLADAHPPPKRAAVSATRQFRPGCGPHEAASVASAEAGSRSQHVAGARVGSAVLEKAAAAGPLAGGKDGALLGPVSPAAAASLVSKLSAVDGDGHGPVADDGDRGPEAGVVKSSEALRRTAVAAPDDLLDDGSQGVAAVLVETRGKDARSGEPGRKALMPDTCLQPNSGTFTDERSFPPGFGKDAVLSLLVGRGIGEVCLPLESGPADGDLGVMEEVIDGSVSTMLKHDMIVPPCSHTTDAALHDNELEEGEIPPEVVVQEVQVPTSVTLHESSACVHGAHVPEISAIESSTMQSSNEKIGSGSTLQCGEKSSSCLLANSDEVGNKSIRSSGNVVAESSDEDSSRQNMMGSGVPECSMVNTTPFDIAAGVCGSSTMRGSVTLHDSTACRHGDSVLETSAVQSSNVKIGGNALQCGESTSPSLVTMRSKVMFTPRKVIKPIKVIQKSTLDREHRTFPEDKEKDTELHRRVIINKIEDTDDITTDRVQQHPMFSDKCLATQEKGTATSRGFFGPRKRVKAKVTDYPRMKIAPACALGSNGKLDDEMASKLEDDILKALVVHEGKLEQYLGSSSNLTSARYQNQDGSLNADARSKFKMLCRRFEFVCRALVQVVEQQSLKVRRIDLHADKVIRRFPGFVKPDPIVGQVPGVEVGDEFLYRVQLVLVGLHRAYQGGIDTTIYRDDKRIAISIVASGGYPDELSCSGELIYTGSGGKPARNKDGEDQKLVRGNLALKNCIKTKTPVRVIHGFKAQNTEGGSHSRAKEVSMFIYDGLYRVVHFWIDCRSGSRVFKYKLQKIPGQPELPMHIAKGMKKSERRPGLCLADISQGKEGTPICVINTVDDVRPAPFQYATRIKYPIGLAKIRHQGCDCINGCSDSETCTCAVKNGGEIPFNLNGAIVKEKPLIFECGPSCKCPPSCQNRVSQHGMKIPLEVFRTTKTGWGVRSLMSISSGSFICEYVGELLYGKEADKKRNNDYLFDIGLNSFSEAMEDAGFTLDAAEYGNIGRFINHSCSPNLYTQNVLWDHDNKRMPRIMFFAAETIPPLQELTYNYNYEIDHVEDANGTIKFKVCQCGSPQCSGSLY